MSCESKANKISQSTRKYGVPFLAAKSAFAAGVNKVGQTGRMYLSNQTPEGRAVRETAKNAAFGAAVVLGTRGYFFGSIKRRDLIRTAASTAVALPLTYKTALTREKARVARRKRAAQKREKKNQAPE